jgi:DNA replicative helicase MCM subunit Mcm2 (Cdc46/Mcm family)
MSTIREILYQHAKGNSQRQISRSFDLSRDTIRKYIDLAKQENFSVLVSDAELKIKQQFFCKFTFHLFYITRSYLNKQHQ